MTNQHIFITGGASGIGAAAVRLFSNRGWKVTFSDINKEWGNSLSEELGDGVLFVAADTRNREEIKTAIAAGIEKYGPLCSVFANAGIHRANTMLDISDEELKLMIDTNIYGAHVAGCRLTYHRIRRWLGGNQLLRPMVCRQTIQFWLWTDKGCTRTNHQIAIHRPRKIWHPCQCRLCRHHTHSTR